MFEIRERLQSCQQAESGRELLFIQKKVRVGGGSRVGRVSFALAWKINGRKARKQADCDIIISFC